ncbi:glycosyltransferase family 2 protein [Fontimonas sp. SYSU GA230001]|uniref:glycosyltransferase family 2 protein n=1 Tax=Fontimonas sp. SYSU GA230001 TaxID=3142450 RepID=UPI0032B595ED
MGVIVTYDPPAGLTERVRAVLRETARVVIVDNGSRTEPALDTLDGTERTRVHLLKLGRNLGLAAALNRGIEAAAALGATTSLLLDHDSTPTPGMVGALLAARSSHADPQSIAAVVPTIAYAHPDIRCRWPQSDAGQWLRFRFAVAAQLDRPTPVDLAIGSGMLISIDVWRELGGFDEGLFIDLVDTDFCLRARSQGFEILATPDAVLDHRLGEVRKNRLLGLIPVFPTHHSALRHYYISRNRILLAKRHARRFPNWLIYELLGAAKLIVKVAVFEQGRWRKLLSMCKGTWDGLRSQPSPQWQSGR